MMGREESEIAVAALVSESSVYIYTHDSAELTNTKSGILGTTCITNSENIRETILNKAANGFILRDCFLPTKKFDDHAGQPVQYTGDLGDVSRAEVVCIFQKQMFDSFGGGNYDHEQVIETKFYVAEFRRSSATWDDKVKGNHDEVLIAKLEQMLREGFLFCAALPDFSYQVVGLTESNRKLHLVGQRIPGNYGEYEIHRLKMKVKQGSMTCEIPDLQKLVTSMGDKNFKLVTIYNFLQYYPKRFKEMDLLAVFQEADSQYEFKILDIPYELIDGLCQPLKISHKDWISACERQTAWELVCLVDCPKLEYRCCANTLSLVKIIYQRPKQSNY